MQHGWETSTETTATGPKQVWIQISLDFLRADEQEQICLRGFMCRTCVGKKFLCFRIQIFLDISRAHEQEQICVFLFRFIKITFIIASSSLELLLEGLFAQIHVNPS